MPSVLGGYDLPQNHYSFDALQVFFFGDDGYRNKTHASDTTRNTCSQPPPQNLKERDRQHQDLLGVLATTKQRTGTRNKPEWNSTFAAKRGERWPEWQGVRA